MAGTQRGSCRPSQGRCSHWGPVYTVRHVREPEPPRAWQAGRLGIRRSPPRDRLATALSPSLAEPVGQWPLPICWFRPRLCGEQREGSMAFFVCVWVFAVSVPSLGELQFNSFSTIHGPRTVTLPAIDRPRAGAMSRPIPLFLDSPRDEFHSFTQARDPSPVCIHMSLSPFSRCLLRRLHPQRWMDPRGPVGKKTSTNKPPRALWLCRSGPPRLRRCGRRRAPAMGSMGQATHCASAVAPPKPSSCSHCRPHQTANIPRPRSRIRKAGRLAAWFLSEFEGNTELHGKSGKKEKPLTALPC